MVEHRRLGPLLIPKGVGLSPALKLAAVVVGAVLGMALIVTGD